MIGNSNQNGSRVTSDPAFQSIQKNKPGLILWRIENMQLVAVPKDCYGTFFKSDTYLVYASLEGASSRSLTQHIHLWIGADSTTVRLLFVFIYLLKT